jgi:hypothetical protein
MESIRLGPLGYCAFVEGSEAGHMPTWFHGSWMASPKIQMFLGRGELAWNW